MKRIFLVLMVLLLASTPFLASAETGEGFGGSILWPEFRGMQLGLSMPYVLLYEEYYNGNDPEPVDWPLALENDAAYSAGTVDLAGVTCDVVYIFKDNTLRSVTCTARLEDSVAALEWCDAMEADFTALYGALSEFAFPEWNDDLYHSFWQERSSELPYQIVVPDYGRLFTSEYLWPQAYVRCTPTVDGDYGITASVSMPYTYSANADYTGPTDGLTDVEKDSLLVDKYHDSRYYPAD